MSVYIHLIGFQNYLCGRQSLRIHKLVKYVSSSTHPHSFERNYIY